MLCQDLMEPVLWDRDPERAAVADFAIREQAQRHTGHMLPTEQVRTGAFRMGAILLEGLFTEAIPMVRATG